MLERIKKIIEEKGLQASSFADKIQVSRGAISHILNERNAPSNDTIKKILENFPDISSDWLVRGEGPMYNHERIFIQPSSSSIMQPDLFNDKKNIEPTVNFPESEILQKEIRTTENKQDSPIIQNINIATIPSKKIDKIMIFFNDKTFMTFIAEE